MSKKKIYYADVFQDCFVTKKERNAPPERYFIAKKNSLDIYVDTFYLKDIDCYIDFSWLPEQKSNWSKLVINHFESHNLGNAWGTARLVKRLYPPKIFDELIKEV